MVSASPHPTSDPVDVGTKITTGAILTGDYEECVSL